MHFTCHRTLHTPVCPAPLQMERSQTVEGLQLLVYLEPHVALLSRSAHPQWNHRSVRRSFGTTRGPIKWLACLLCFIPGPCLRSLAPWLNPRNNSAAATGDGGEWMLHKTFPAQCEEAMKGEQRRGGLLNHPYRRYRSAARSAN